MTDINAITARQLAGLGFFVFPCSADKRPVTGLKWREASSNEPGVIASMWSEHPNALPAVDCGKSGLFIVDLDRHDTEKDGCAAFEALEAQYGRITDAPRIKTPNNGVHVYFRQPEGEPLGNSSGRLPAGVDCRGAGGYIISPGAILPDHRRYEVDASFPRLSEVLSNGGLHTPPQWVLDLIRTPVAAQSAPEPRYYGDNADDERAYIEAALRSVSPDDRDVWLRFGGALHDAGHSWGRIVWDNWSRQSSKFNAADQESTWKSFDRQTGRKASLGSIVEEARRCGFTGRKHRATYDGRYNVEDASPAPVDWPLPKPLPEGLRPVAPFDLRFLPARLAPWVGDIVDRLQCAPDFVGVSALVAMGATIGRKVGIRPQNNTDWTEVCNLWGMPIGRPGLMKSPAMEEALKPLKRLETSARKLFEDDVKAFELAAATHKIVMAEAQARASKAAKAGGDIAGILSSIDTPDEPKAKRYIVNDTSYEALGEIMADNPNGVLAFRDELVSLLRMLDREEFAGARGFFLTAWNGTSGYTFDRIIRGRKHIDAACLSLLGSTQPGRISEYIRRATNGGSGDDGLIQRFGLLVWPDTSPTWKEIDRYPNTEARRNAWQTFDNLDAITPESVGAVVDEFDALAYLRFDAEAGDVFRNWRQDLERRLRGDDLSPSLESHLAKYRKLVPALALINHLADGGVGDVTLPSMLRALACADYLETHAKRAYGAGLEIETSSAKAILKHIRNGDLLDGFTLRDIHQRDWSSLTDRNHVKAGLDLLCDLDWLMSKTDQTGGRPRTTYTINPRGVA